MQGSLDQPPIVLRGRRGRGVPLLVFGLPMLIVGALMWTRTSSAAAGGLFVFVVGFFCVTAGILTIVVPPELTIGAEGLVLKGALRTRTYGWGQAANFRLVQLRRTTLIGFDRPGAQNIMSDVASALRTVAVSSNYDAVLPGRWDAPVETVVETLNGARAKWGGLAAARAPMLRPRQATGQRINRRVYWISLGVLTLIGGMVALLTHGTRFVGYGTLAMWVWLVARRLHDIGCSGWWQAAVFPIQFLLALVLIGVFHFSASAAMGPMVLALLAFIAGLGTIPGNPGDNRFGPPPGVLEPERQAEVFS